MDVTITGAGGFVGRHLMPYLAQQGHTPHALSLRHAAENEPVLLPACNAVIHLAGKAHDHQGKATKEEYFYVNKELTIKVFEQFLESSAEIFIHFSTVAAVADGSVDGVLTEETPAAPVTPYGISKYQAEQYLLNRALPQGKKVYILRPAMIHGPGDKGNLTLLYKVVAKGIPYPLAAFNNRRSFLGIDNLCYIVEAMLRETGQIPSGIYNLVDDEPVATLDIVKYISNALGKKVRLLYLPPSLIRLIAKVGDVLPFPLNTKRLIKLTGDYVVSNRKIKKALGIDHLPLSAMEGLKKTIVSFRNEQESAQREF